MGTQRTTERSDGLRVLIAGGGVAALEAMLALRALAEERAEIELLAPEAHFTYRPLAVAEPFGAGRVERWALSDFTSAVGAKLTLGALVEVDGAARVARTAGGSRIAYDVLLIACGALASPSLRGAFTFRGPEDTDAYRELLGEIEVGGAERLVFAVPGGTTWPLPLYELCLQTAIHFVRRGLKGIELAFVSYESEPLQLFGTAASTAVRRLLDERGIVFHPRTYPGWVEEGELALIPRGSLPADRVVTLPRLEGQRIEGVSCNAQGFIPTDLSGHVTGLPNVFAAGDVTAFPVKHGGLAAQQADAAAEAIAALAGAPITPQPFTPVLRGLLLTGGVPTYLRSELGSRGDTPSTFAEEPLWWPPGKIVGRYLAPALAARMVALPPEPPTGQGVLPVSVDLSKGEESAWQPS